MREDHDEAENTEPLNSDAYSLLSLVITPSPPPFEGIYLALPEETVMASPEAVTM